MNLLEMWACALFQTLPTKALIYIYIYIRLLAQRYPTIPLPRTSQHYSSSLPKSGRELSGDQKSRTYISFPDIQQHLKALRQKFFDLKNSKDATLREYYYSVHRNLRAQGAAAKKEKTRQRALSGINVIIRQTLNGSRYFTLGHVVFRISTSLDLQAGMEVCVQCCLLPDRHPHVYATDALDYDPAIRLGVKVTGKGHVFEAWLFAGGTQTVKQMNTFAEILEGVDIEEIEKKKRRYLPVNGEGDRLLKRPS